MIRTQWEGQTLPEDPDAECKYRRVRMPMRIRGRPFLRVVLWDLCCSVEAVPSMQSSGDFL